MWKAPVGSLFRVWRQRGLRRLQGVDHDAKCGRKMHARRIARRLIQQDVHVGLRREIDLAKPARDLFPVSRDTRGVALHERLPQRRGPGSVSGDDRVERGLVNLREADGDRMHRKAADREFAVEVVHDLIGLSLRSWRGLIVDDCDADRSLQWRFNEVQSLPHDHDVFRI